VKKACNININGLVQGVGFRPFVYLLAQKHHLKGWVSNRNDCVNIRVSGDKSEIEGFIEDLKTKKPGVATISQLSVKEEPYENYKSFEIVSSESISDEITEISPDLAVCDDCLADMINQDHRRNYPFVNCTYCGPRFSIIKSLPYDRPNTTMDEFKMCSLCENEYSDVHDRRFHAQPVACNNCGPHYKFYKNGKVFTNDQRIVQQAANIINKNGIVAIKGIGGYFMACDAHNAKVVQRLRSSKKRYGKPFAVMFRDLEAIKLHAELDYSEEELLKSIKRPIVLLKLKKHFTEGVADGLKSIGAMLPYMPFHYLLFEKVNTDALVLTSGNFFEEPIIIDDVIARERLPEICDAVVSYNRKIHNRVDDSVIMVVNHEVHLIRRSRGFAPEPISTHIDLEGILATGAELVNCFAIGKKDKAILSQHIGDLKNFETYNFYQESYGRFKELFRFQPTLIACDMHPDYLSSRFTDNFDVPVIKVQHHHAHLASCMVENEYFGKAIGVCLDGTGYGTDGNIWGGEFLVGDLCSFERYFHFEYVPICGGDKAAYSPWRSGLSYLHYHGLDYDHAPKRWESLKHQDIRLVLNSLEKNINCPLSSSAGRLFDAVAALTGICYKATYHAEAPMRMESKIIKHCDDSYRFEIFDEEISFENSITDLMADLKEGITVGTVVTKFHNTIVDVILSVSRMLRDETGISTVALSGGTFQNRYILEKAWQALKDDRFIVLTQRKVPSNDGGIALGQIAIAATKRKELCV